MEADPAAFSQDALADTAWSRDKLCPNYRLMSKTNEGGCFKPLGFGVVCYTQKVTATRSVVVGANLEKSFCFPIDSKENSECACIQTLHIFNVCDDKKNLNF